MRKIAVLGFGTVGSGTVESFYYHKDKILKENALDTDIKYILDLRDFPESPYNDKVIHDFSIIENDSEIAVAAELMGGINPAYDFTKRLLKKGISVVTSNKELVARHGAELLILAKEKNCNYFFEASTGGAIPIIRTLHDSLSANYIYKLQGILNGTTNFILTKMLDEQMPYKEALKLSQKLGYAERDPTADVSGADSCRKICILASIIFGKHILPEWVTTKGIEKITTEDAAFAESFGAKIKLIASAEKERDSDKIFITVEPHLVCNGNQLSHVSDVYNAVMVDASSAGRLMFYGSGAGKLPTASAVLSDITAALIANGTQNVLLWEDCTDEIIIDSKTVKRGYYLKQKDTDGQVIYGLSEEEITDKYDNIISLIPILE
ncbi:MAG: homoserine dehydrogenase [Ruminococcus sp.]|jgi:homoserine dehydrogenase|nr:homoserine dehydrogenase [Ruminococcus sp.]